MHNRKIICLAVDDEPPALEVIKKYIAAVPSLQLAGVCADGVEALTMLQQHAVDLLFLDIQMPQLFGTDLVRTLHNPPKIIFTTAFRKFAVEGFELDAVDYLLKPVSFERFLKAVNKVMGASFQTAMPNEPAAVNPAEGYVSLRADRKNIKILLSDICYVESIKDYIKVVTPAKTIIARQSISALEEILPKALFVRIHRSYIVSINRIETFTSELVGIGKQELPISRMYRYEVAKILRND